MKEKASKSERKGNGYSHNFRLKILSNFLKSRFEISKKLCEAIILYICHCVCHTFYRRGMRLKKFVVIWILI